MSTPYFITPEFHRNLWLKFSRARLVLVPVVIAIIVWIIFVGSKQSPFSSLMYAALFGYFVVVAIWGNYEAANALQEEIRGKTWDFQRMSPMTPGRLAFGKLFGVTSFTWYIGLICVAIFIFSYSRYTPPPLPAYISHLNCSPQESAPQGNAPLPPTRWQQGPDGKFRIAPQQPLGPARKCVTERIPNPKASDAPQVPDTPGNILYIAVFLILSGIAGQVVSFLISLSDFASARSKLGRLYIPKSAFPFICGTIISWNFSYFAASRMHVSAGDNPPDAITWFGALFDEKAFALMSLLFFLGWGLTGIYRLTRAEFMYPQTPTVWALASLAIPFYFLGFINMQAGHYFQTVSFRMFFCTLFIMYVSMMLEAADIEKYRRFYAYMKEKNWRRMFINMPRWVSLLAFLGVFYISTLAAVAHGNPAFTTSTLSLLTMAILFAARDGIFVHGLYMSPPPRQVSFYLVLYLALSYWLLPALYSSLTKDPHMAAGKGLFSVLKGNNMPDASSASALTIFYPMHYSNPVLAVIPVLLEISVALLWLKQRQKSLAGA